MSDIEKNADATSEAQPQPVPTHTVKKNDTVKKRKKAKGDVSTSAERPSFEELGITDPKITSVLERGEARWHLSERMDTEVIFIRGSVVAEAKKVCDQKQMDVWSKARLKVTGRGAANYERVHRELGDRSERFIAAGVKPVVMYEIAGAEADKVEAVLRLYEAGGSMTGEEAAAFVKQADAEIASDGELAELSGADGIHQMVKEKVKVTIPEITKSLQFILAACLAALDDHHRGVRVKKGELADTVEHEARLVRGKLENLAFMVKPGRLGQAWNLYPEAPSPSTGWGNMALQLHKLGGRDGWGDPLGPWLIGTIIPAVEWGLGSKLAQATRAQDAKRLEAISGAKAAAKAKTKAGRTKSVKAKRPRDASKIKVAEAAVEIVMPKLEPAPEQPKEKSAPAAPEVAKAAKPKKVQRPTFLDGLARIVEAADLASPKA